MKPQPRKKGDARRLGSETARSKRWRVIGALWIALNAAICAQAQSYSIDPLTIASGGGTSTGGVYCVSGTIGQADAGKLSGGGYTLDGGFWSLAVAIQTPGAPFLSVVRSGENVIVSWPSNSLGFVLQETATLAAPGSWQNSSPAPVIAGTNHTFTLPASPGLRFYRLRKP